METIKIYFDGSNFGHRICVYDQSQNKIIVKEVPEAKTNNELEYNALLIAIRYANRTYGDMHEVQFIGDSQLVVKQVMGKFAINYEHLRKLKSQVIEELVKGGYKASSDPVVWVRREENIAGWHLSWLMDKDKGKICLSWDEYFQRLITKRKIQLHIEQK